MLFLPKNIIGRLLQQDQQYWIRLLIGLFLLSVLFWQYSGLPDPSKNNHILLIIAGYILLTTALLYLKAKAILEDSKHQYLTIFADASAISLLLIFGGESTSPICIIYYLTVVHNGINTQTPKLLLSVSLAIIGFTAALYWNSYWGSQTTLGTGLLSGLIILSLAIYWRTSKNKNINQNSLCSDKSSHPEATTICRKAQNSLKLLLVTNDYKDRHMVLSHIDTWGINVHTNNNAIRAFVELVNEAESGNGYTTVIVDSLNLDMDPIQFAKTLQTDHMLRDIDLIFISPDQSIEQKEQLLDAGYTKLLKTPIDKTILFDALHTSKAQTADDQNITRLIHHYSSSKSNKQPSDILLAVANPAEQKIFRNILERDGQRVYTIQNGSEALDALNTHQFDMVIIDFKMPDIGGKELIRLYHYTYLDEEWVPFIALVDEATPKTLSQCREAEVSAVLVRPIKEDKLIATVADIASSKTKQADSYCQLPHIHKTQIKGDDNQIINTQTLIQLENLSSSSDFLSQLVSKFNEDMSKLANGMKQSIHNNCFTDFKDLAHALKDSSCNLGAISLYRLSLLALQINQREFQGQAKSLLNEIDQTLSKTKYALQNYVIERDSSASERE